MKLAQPTTAELKERIAQLESDLNIMQHALDEVVSILTPEQLYEIDPCLMDEAA